MCINRKISSIPTITISYTVSSAMIVYVSTIVDNYYMHLLYYSN